MDRLPPRRRGFNLLEIMVSMFILALGLMMIAGSLPVGLRQSSDSQDLSMSSFAARAGTAQVRQLSNRKQLPIYVTAGDPLENAAAMPCVAATTTCVHWYGPSADQYSNGYTAAGAYVPGTIARWFVNQPATPTGWGQAIPIPFDDRYAYQMFYRRTQVANSDAVNGPFIYTISIVVQTKRDNTFSRPITEAEMRAATPPAGTRIMGTDDIYCDPNGVWRKFGSGSNIPAGKFGFGIPGSMGVFETTLAF